MANSFQIDLNLTNVGGGLSGGFGNLTDKQGNREGIAKFSSPFGDQINQIGLNMATLGAATVKLIGGFQLLYRQSLQLTERFAELSPNLQAARAINEIRDIQQNIRLAQQAGPDLARLAIAQGDISRKIDEAATKLLIAFTPLLAGMAESTVKVADRIVETKGTVDEAMRNAAAGYAGALVYLAKLTGTTEHLQKFAQDYLKDAQAKAAREAAEEAFILKTSEDFLDPKQTGRFFGNAPAPGAQPQPPQPMPTGGNVIPHGGWQW